MTDNAQTRDVSKAGLSFFSSKVFRVGEEIYLVLPFAANQVLVLTKAKLIWPSLGTTGRDFGVAYLMQAWRGNLRGPCGPSRQKLLARRIRANIRAIGAHSGDFSVCAGPSRA